MSIKSYYLSHRTKTMFFFYLAFVVVSLFQIVKSEKMRLADCPKETEEGVIGTYYNNGKKCVREKAVMKRERRELICPFDMEFKRGFCRSKNDDAKTNTKESNVKPTCSDGFRSGYTGPNNSKKNKICMKICPKGHLTKNDKCILPRDVFSRNYMSCPNEGDHRLDVYCTSLEVQCSIPNARGILDSAHGFRYRAFDGACERPKQVLVREYTVMRKNITECDNSIEVLLYTPTVRVCQEPCPSPLYKAKKGKCVLPKCVLRPQDMSSADVRCPEGTYSQTSSSFQ